MHNWPPSYCPSCNNRITKGMKANSGIRIMGSRRMSILRDKAFHLIFYQEGIFALG